MKYAFALVASLAGAALSHAQPAPPTQDNPPPTPSFEECARIDNDVERLRCYDRAAGRTRPELVPAAQEAPPAAGRTIESAAEPAALEPGLAGPPETPSVLSRFWELDRADKRGVFNFTGYRPNFFLPVHVSTQMNTTPTSPAPDHTATVGPYQRTEAKFQISLRTKVAQGLLLPDADLWVGYTQQSLWQLYNHQNSSPFRDTNYEPEVNYVVPVPRGLQVLPLGWRWRFGEFGFAHQSNGQSGALSRSWNRLFMGGGLENDDISFLVRYNHRVHESSGTDDNPDLVDYRGATDLVLAWTPGRATASVTRRANLGDFSRGSWQLDWTYPVHADSPRALRWYVQLFTGYGETLLDYNFKQTSLSAGLTLFEF
ncbi:MAG TPA: phospholipase A [Burkholderiaceae bacterium]|nr:phospholipase A [Burkholderiaceae bacterium]